MVENSPILLHRSFIVTDSEAQSYQSDDESVVIVCDTLSDIAEVDEVESI